MPFFTSAPVIMSISPRSFPSTRLLRWLVLGAAVVLPSCGSLNPLYPIDEAKPDERLFGRWVLEGEGNTTFYFIGRPTQQHVPAGVMRLWEISTWKDHRLEARSWYFTSSHLRKASYANIIALKTDQDQWDAQQIEGYLLIKYKVERDRLVVWFMDPDPVTAAVKSKRLKGKAEKVTFFQFDTVVISEDAESLRRFIIEEDSRLFPKESFALARQN